MVRREMAGRWTTYEFQFSCIVLLILVSNIRASCSLNSEGLALLEFRALVNKDPSGALGNWNPDDCSPCAWSGVHCLDGKVDLLDLNGHELEGKLAPALGNLTLLRFLDLSRNHFSGTIPEQFGKLNKLEVLDLRDNNLSGPIPAELGELHLLKRLLLCNNRFDRTIPFEIGKLNFLTDLWLDDNLTAAAANAGIGIWQGVLKPTKKPESFMIPFKGTVMRYLNRFLLLKFGNEASQDHCDDGCSNLSQNEVYAPRRVLAEQSSNLAAAPAPASSRSQANPVIALPSSRSSGSFSAVPNNKKASPAPAPSVASPPPSEHNSPEHNSPGAPKQADKQAHAAGRSGPSWKLIVGIAVPLFLLIVAAVLLFICRSKAAKTIGPWKTGLSGQLQKAFVTGVPKLNRAELESACEDFSNIVITGDVATVYKGTLSSGVEIAVVSSAIVSLRDWSKHAELTFRKKVDTLSRVNHKNFVNLIGYCEDDEPFSRMMVFEYAPNGSLSEHLHVQEVEHLDWSARMRIIMGTAYCLQYMHELNPPVLHPNLSSRAIFLTDDYAAKIGDIGFWTELIAKANNLGEKDSQHADMEMNVYSFGIMLLEVISGKPPHSEEQGPLVNWAAQYLNDKRSISYLIDPTLKSFKDNELDAVCEVIQCCVQEDARKRPTMKEVVQKLRLVLDISPEQATPRLSPLWWAELEILSAEAA